MKEEKANKHIPKNLVFNVLSFVINVLIGLWLVPYLFDYLGEAAYGLIPLAMVFTEYISVIAISINGSISRFLTIDIQKRNWVNANKTFNTAFFALTVLIFIQIAVLGYITYDLQFLISVPYGLLKDAYYLFAFTFLAYLISLVSSVFSTSMYAYNRLDLILSGNIAKTIIRTAVIVILFVVFRPSLMIVGIANLVGSLVIFSVSFYYWRKLTPDLRVSHRFFEKSRLKGLTGMGGWLIVNQVGYLLFLKIDLFVVNKYLGANAGGQYAAVLQWSSLIRTMSGILSGVLGPMILISFANDDMKGVIKYAKIGVKYLSIAVGLITGVICGFSFEVMTIWLGDEFGNLSVLLIVMLCHLTINLGVLPLLPINTALNKVKIPGIITFVMGVFNLILALFFVWYTDLGFVGVALAGLIVLTLKNGLFSPWYAAKILAINRYTFFKELKGGLITFALAIFCSKLISELLTLNGWFWLFFGATLVCSVILFVIWKCLLSKDERLFTIELIKKNVNG